MHAEVRKTADKREVAFPIVCKGLHAYIAGDSLQLIETIHLCSEALFGLFRAVGRVIRHQKKGDYQ